MDQIIGIGSLLIGGGMVLRSPGTPDPVMAAMLGMLYRVVQQQSQELSACGQEQQELLSRLLSSWREQLGPSPRMVLAILLTRDDLHSLMVSLAAVLGAMLQQSFSSPELKARLTQTIQELEAGAMLLDDQITPEDLEKMSTLITAAELSPRQQWQVGVLRELSRETTPQPWWVQPLPGQSTAQRDLALAAPEA